MLVYYFVSGKVVEVGNQLGDDDVYSEWYGVLYLSCYVIVVLRFYCYEGVV